MTNLGPKVDIGRVFGQDITYAVLAAAFHVNAYDVLIEVYRAKGTNGKAFHDLYQVFMKANPWLTSYTELTQQAAQYWHQAHGGTDGIAKQDLPFLNWTIPKGVVIRLPKAAAGAALIEADAAVASRYIKLAIDCPEFAKIELLAQHLDQLASKLEALVNQLEGKVVTRTHDSLAYIVSAQRLATMMYDVIPNTPKATVDYHVNDHLDLIDFMGQLLEHGARLMTDEPALFDRELHKSISSAAAELIAEFVDSDNIERIRKLAPYYDVADRRDNWAALESALIRATSALVRSNRGDDFVEQHLMPFFEGVAEKADVQRLVDRVQSEPFKDAILKGWRTMTPKTKDSIFATIGAIGSIGAGAIGNSRGPASLAVSLVMVGGPVFSSYIAHRSLKLSNAGTVGATFAIRVLMRVTDMASDTDLDHLLEAILPAGKTPPDLAAIKKVKWSHKLMSSSLWAGVYALANLAAFLSIITSDHDRSREALVQLVQSGAQLAVPLAEIAGALLDKKGKTNASLKVLGSANRVAQFAGALAFFLAVWVFGKEIAEAYQDKDIDVGDVIDIAGSAGTIASVGAWFVIEFGASAAVWGGVMAFGSILSMCAVVAAIGYREAMSGPGTAAYIVACLDTFKASDYGKLLLSDKRFREDFDDLIDYIDAVKPKLVSFKGKQDELYTLMKYFSIDGCATIVEMDPAVVREIVGLK
ncbi:hypothetical protein [Enhygromyxa salina]|nr:hypothetical protein [Enhygromyxa salina]